MNIHIHNTTANTDECFRTFIGCKVKGLVREVTFDGEHANILVFDCNWGLAFNSNGSHWSVNPEKVLSLIRKARKELENNKQELENIYKLSGKEVI